MSHWKAACPKCGRTVGISHVKPLADTMFTTCGCRRLAFWEEVTEEPAHVIKDRGDRYKAIVDLYIMDLSRGGLGYEESGRRFCVKFPSGTHGYFPTYEAAIEALEKICE
jgi:hypothetical protein